MVGGADRQLRSWGWQLTVLLGMLLAAEFGLSLTIGVPPTAPLWPAAGVAVAALTCAGRKLAPAVFLGALIAAVIGLMRLGAGFGWGLFAGALALAIAQTLSAGLTARLWRRYAQDSPTDRVRGVLHLLWITPLAWLINAVAGTLVWMGDSLWTDPAQQQVALCWWLGDITGVLVIAPWLLAFALADSPGRTRPFERVLLILAIVVTLGILFGPLASPAQLVSLNYLLLPILFWAALRMRARIASSLLVLVAVVSVWATVRGLGGFAALEPLQAVLNIQMFLACAAAFVMLLIATRNERARVLRALADAKAELEQRVDERTASLADAISALSESLAATREAEQANELRRERERLLQNEALELFADRALFEAPVDSAMTEVALRARGALRVERVSIWLHQPASPELILSGVSDDAVNVGPARMIDRVDTFEAERVALGIQARLDTAVTLAGERIGLVFAEQRSGPREWQPEESNFLAAVADVVAQLVSGVERRSSAERMAESERRLRDLYDDTPSMYFTLDPNGRVRSVNQFGARQLGYLPEDLIGMDFMALSQGIEREQLLAHLNNADPDRREVYRWEQRLSSRRGGVLWVRVSARGRIQSGGGAGVLLVCEDISEIHALEEELRHQASHDHLTSLLSRPAFEIALAGAVSSARREGSEHALCYLDLDQFKIVNDTCGHVAGDALLRQLAAILLKHLPFDATLARLGGDEFGVLLRDTQPDNALAVADRLRAAVEAFRFSWEGRMFAVGVSIGLVPINERSESGAGVMSAADAACYAAKERGRNRVHMVDESSTEVRARRAEMEWVGRLVHAIEDSRMELHYQPIRPLQYGVDVGLHYELLLRLRDERGALVLPESFLPAAERYQLMQRIDAWVVRTCLEGLSRNPAHVESLECCAINLSGLSLGDDGFLQVLLGLLDQFKVPASKLCFEVTETAAVAHLSQATRMIELLRARGIRFALDDFGSGFSSFAYLKQLPVDYIKIDGRFVRGGVTDAVDIAVVTSMSQVARALGIQSVAESVETEQVRARLTGLAVDYGQGFLLGAPRPWSELCP